MGEPLRARVGWLLLLASLASCTRPGTGERAFYFWRAHFELDAQERDAITRAHVTRLYLRLFDVVATPDAPPHPIAQTTFASPVPAGVEVVPVVYIANAAIAATADPEALAQKIWQLVVAAAREGGFEFREVQLDCDWNTSTRERYFALCARLRELAQPRQLSVTIRLHQVKYRERTGVPPADRGMLMFYNMGHIEPDASQSSIFSAADAQRYLARVDEYPLPLDVGLPLFSWAVHARDGHVVGLIDKPAVAELDALPALEHTSPGLYRAREASLLHGAYLEPGDTLTLDRATPDVARSAASLLARSLHPRGPHAVALFDLDARNLDDHAAEALDGILSAAP